MKLSYEKYPVDILICLLVSVLLVPIVLLDLSQLLRIIFGLPFLLFIPGYVLIFTLFPGKKTNRGIDDIERVALSFGLSLAVVPLIGLVLNYTPWGIRLEPILASLFIFIVGVGFVGIIRWMRTPSNERFFVSLSFSLPKSKNKVDRILTIILIITIVVALVTLVYVIVTPKVGERFTEFYILGPQGKAAGYPKDLTLGEQASVIVGVTNYEHRLMNYTVEVWLVNQTSIVNSSTNETTTIYHHMWFMKKIALTLNSTNVTTDKQWTPQWEYNYTFTVLRKGNFKLEFLLYNTSTDDYGFDQDYFGIAEHKINSAYRELHLWLHVA